MLLAEELARVEDFSHDNIHGGFERVMQRTGLGLGKIAQPARVALTGSTKSPGIFDVVEILGKDTVALRLARAIDFISLPPLPENEYIRAYRKYRFGEIDCGGDAARARGVHRGCRRGGERNRAARGARSLGNRRLFRRGVLRADGTLDRGALAEIVFTNERDRERLNGITHPRILERIKEKISARSSEPDSVC